MDLIIYSYKFKFLIIIVGPILIYIQSESLNLHKNGSLRQNIEKILVNLKPKFFLAEIQGINCQV